MKILRARQLTKRELRELRRKRYYDENEDPDKEEAEDLEYENMPRNLEHVFPKASTVKDHDTGEKAGGKERLLPRAWKRGGRNKPIIIEDISQEREPTLVTNLESSSSSEGELTSACNVFERHLRHVVDEGFRERRRLLRLQKRELLGEISSSSEDELRLHINSVLSLGKKGRKNVRNRASKVSSPRLKPPRAGSPTNPMHTAAPRLEQRKALVHHDDGSPTSPTSVPPVSHPAQVTDPGGLPTSLHRETLWESDAFHLNDNSLPEEPSDLCTATPTPPSLQHKSKQDQRLSSRHLRQKRHEMLFKAMVDHYSTKSTTCQATTQDSPASKLVSTLFGINSNNIPRPRLPNETTSALIQNTGPLDPSTTNIMDEIKIHLKAVGKYLPMMEKALEEVRESYALGWRAHRAAPTLSLDGCPVNERSLLDFTHHIDELERLTALAAMMGLDSPTPTSNGDGNALRKVNDAQREDLVQPISQAPAGTSPDFLGSSCSSSDSRPKLNNGLAPQNHPKPALYNPNDGKRSTDVDRIPPSNKTKGSRLFSSRSNLVRVNTSSTITHPDESVGLISVSQKEKLATVAAHEPRTAS